MGSVWVATVSQVAALPKANPGVKLAAFSAANFVGLAECFVAACAPNSGAAGLAEAKAELASRLRVDGRRIIPGASPTAIVDDQVVGSIQVAEGASDGPDRLPRVIEFFVHPDFRRRGIGTTLLATAASRLQLAGFEQMALQLPGEPPVAVLRLSERAGFTDLAAHLP